MFRLLLNLFATVSLSNANIIDLVVVSGQYAPCPRGYNKPQYYGGLDGDLNQGCGEDSNYLWFCYQEGSGSAITDLTVFSQDSATDGCGDLDGNWQRIGQQEGSDGDLNQGAHGKYIYMCLTRTGSAAITSLKLADDHGCNGMQAVAQRLDSDGDLNQGAGGNYIYACVSHAGMTTNATTIV